MTTEKTKAALDDLRDLHDAVKSGGYPHEAMKRAETALTAQAEAQPADDEVSEVHEYLTGKYFIVKNGLYYRPYTRGYTVEPNSAGLYSHDEAMSLLKGCSELSIKPAYRIRTALQAAPEVERTADECDSLFNEMMAGIEQNNLEGDHPPFDKKERLAARIFFDFIETNGYLRIVKEIKE